MADAHRIVFLDVNSIAQETELRVELGLEGTVLVLPWSSVVITQALISAPHNHRTICSAEISRFEFEREVPPHGPGFAAVPESG